jgi:hypothetical protein
VHETRETIVRFTLLLFALTLLAYLPVLRGGFIWDDDDYVQNNANLRSGRGLVDTWLAPRTSPQYYPMVFTTFWVEHQLWGDRPVGYHVVNVLLHATAAALLWRVLTRLDVPAPMLAACLFAVHPVHAESVAWVTERKNVLSAVFVLASAYFWVRDRGTRDYVIALALFVLALLSKTVTCALPAALLLIAWWKHGRLTRRDIIRLAPMFAVGFALAMYTAYLERAHVNAVGPEWDLKFVDRVLIAGRAVWFYFGRLVLPVRLSFIYPRWTIDPSQLWQWAFPVGVLVALFVLWRMRTRWGRGPLVAALIFCGALVPALGFFNIYPMRYSFVADHFQYHASIAAIVLIAIALHRFGRAVGIAVVALLLVLTMSRADVFADSERLWRDTYAKNPRSWMVNLNLAKELIARRRHAEAWPYFDALVGLAPNLPETHWNYGSSLRQRRRYAEAIAAYDQAVRLGGDPLPQVLYNRGLTYLEVGRPDLAAADFRRALAVKPDYAAPRDALNQLAP